MVWAGISAMAKTDLVFSDGNLNGQRYIDEVLTPNVLPFLRQKPVAGRQRQTSSTPSSTTFSVLTM